MINHFAMQFLHACHEIILKFKIEEKFVQQIEFDTTIPGINANFARTSSGYAFSCHQYLAMIVLTIATDVYPLFYIFSDGAHSRRR
jgi:hypothetical protein